VQNREFVDAFFDYDEERRFSTANPIEFDKEYFRVSRDVLVPVAPLSIIRERGTFVPIFVCGWNSNPLTTAQRRLLMTIYEDAFLSLTDYQTSPAEILFFPKFKTGDGEEKRETEAWKRGDYALLTQTALNECVEIFVSARELARQVLLDEILQMQREAENQNPGPGRAGGADDLFGEN
jgi:hypothetical protein